MNKIEQTLDSHKDRSMLLDLALLRPSSSLSLHLQMLPISLLSASKACYMYAFKSVQWLARGAQKTTSI
eukprot:6455073-Amphidinium_carterae.1